VNEVKDLLVSIIIALIIVIPFRHFVAEPYIVQGASMSPNYATGDYIIVNKLTSYLTKPERGDVIVFVPPMERNKNTDITMGVTNQFFSGGWKNYVPLIDSRMKFIKRTIGLPGETVKLDGGKVYIKKNGSDKFEKLEEPYIKDHT
jgi:signal peptidase I